MFRFAAILTLVLAAPGHAAASYSSSARPLPASVRGELRSRHVWRPGCPVPLSGLRLLSVSYHGFDGRTHQGQLVVDAAATGPLERAFGRLYALHFPIRDMRLQDAYGPSAPSDGDVTASFSCRQAVPSPCVGGTGTGSGSPVVQPAIFVR